MKRDAILSECGTYRYRLSRQWDDTLPRLGWIMLNPSTADAFEDDPTIRRCIGFAESNGYGGIEVCNLFAYRATDPKALVATGDAFGPENGAHLDAIIGAHTVVAAWGAWGTRAGVTGIVESVHLTARQVGRRLLCLGTTKDGSPRHPLYVRGDQPLVPCPSPWHTEEAQHG